MFLSALSVMVPNCKLNDSLTVDIKNVIFTHWLAFRTVVKRNKGQLQGATWMNFTNRRLSNRSHIWGTILIHLGKVLSICKTKLQCFDGKEKQRNVYHSRGDPDYLWRSGGQLNRYSEGLPEGRQVLFFSQSGGCVITSIMHTVGTSLTCVFSVLCKLDWEKKSQ